MNRRAGMGECEVEGTVAARSLLPAVSVGAAAAAVLELRNEKNVLRDDHGGKLQR